MATSVRDVAEAAGVSVGTVSNVLNRPEKVSAATVDRVQAAISALGFVRNAAARQLRAGTSTSIGLIVLDIRNPFFTEIVRGAERAAEERGLTVLVANSDGTAEREAKLLDQFEQQRVRGVLVTPTGDIMPRLRRMRQRGIPSVLVDSDPRDGAFSCVAVDDVEGGRAAAVHLLETGRRRLAFVGGPLSMRQMADRLHGAGQAVSVYSGATLELIGTEAPTVAAGRRVAQALGARGREARPDAIFTGNDLLALGLLQGLVMAGETAVPGELAIVGYDDIDFAAAAVVPLSSVRQPAELIGATAVELLLEEDDEHSRRRVVHFHPDLIVRATSAPVDGQP